MTNDFKEIRELNELNKKALKKWGVKFNTHKHGIESIEFTKSHNFTPDEIALLIDTRHQAIELLNKLQAERGECKKHNGWCICNDTLGQQPTTGEE